MSIALMTIAWRMDLPASDKMVLLALADAANDDGVTWLPISGRAGKQGLIQKTSLGERCIQGCIVRLVAAGHLSRDERPGKGVLYTVHPQTGLPLDTPAANAPRSKCAPHVVRQTPARRAPKPSYNHTPEEADASSTPRGQAQRGSRIPMDWTPPPVEELPPQAQALARQWPAGAYAVEAEAFVSYWLAESGPRARKSDWRRAWCNRIVQYTPIVLRSAKSGVRYDTLAPKPTTDWAARAKHAEERAQLYDKIGRPDDAADARREAERFWHIQASAAAQAAAAA